MLREHISRGGTRTRQSHREHRNNHAHATQIERLSGITEIPVAATSPGSLTRAVALTLVVLGAMPRNKYGVPHPPPRAFVLESSVCRQLALTVVVSLELRYSRRTIRSRVEANLLSSP